MVKKLLFAMIFSFFALSSPYLLRKATGEFRVGKLALDLPYNSAWSSVGSSPEEGLFKGTFSYLNHGAQSFVFESEDGEWTLKLFRHDRWIHPWRKFIRNELLGKKKRLPYDQKIDRLFCAAKLAFEKAADLTGIVYVHLNRTEGVLPTILLKDSLGRKQSLDLNRAHFVVQHRARPIAAVFLEAIQEGDHEKFYRLSRSFANLLKCRAARGIRNADTKVDRNFGFWKEHAIEWDFGNYWIDREMESEEDRIFEMSRFMLKPERFMRNFPEWAEEYRRVVIQ